MFSNKPLAHSPLTMYSHHRSPVDLRPAQPPALPPGATPPAPSPPTNWMYATRIINYASAVRPKFSLNLAIYLHRKLNINQTNFSWDFSAQLPTCLPFAISVPLALLARWSRVSLRVSEQDGKWGGCGKLNLSRCIA